MFPSEVLVSSDKRPYRNLTFHDVLARQDSFCNRARLNFQAFTLPNMRMAAQELKGYRVGQKLSNRFSFC